MRKLLSHWLHLLVLCLLTIFLTRNLWSTRAWIETHDGIFHLIRQEVFIDELKSGQFPVRWAGSLDNGLGLPLFNYIYPGPYYLGSVFSLLGLSSKWVIKIVEIGLYLLGGLGFYTLFARRDRLLALITSLLYLTTPYLLLNIFVRGSLGEFMAISLIPWVFVSLQNMRSRRTLEWYHPLPYFLLFISHNFLSFLFLPIYLILTFLDRTAIKNVLKSLVVSVFLSAFFIIPMINERGLLYSVSSGNFTYSFADHFVYPLQLIYSRWGIGHSYAGTGDGFSFALGLANLAVLFIAILTLFYKRSRDIYTYLALTLLIIFFLLPISLPLWKIIFPLQIIQFPWRLLSLTTITIPLLAFSLLTTYRSYKYFATVVAVLLLGNLAFAVRYSTPFYFQNNDQLSTQLYIHRKQTTTSSRLEMLPKWGAIEPKWIGSEHLRIDSGIAEVINLTSTPVNITFESNAQDDGVRYRIRRNYFPSWFVRDELGDTYPVTPTADGELSFVGKTGNHTYNVFVGSTPVERVSNWISLAGLLYLLSLIIRPKMRDLIDDKFKDWDISIALRYLPIVAELKKLSQPRDKILEIGSEITGITPYLKRKIIGLDQGFDYTRQNKYLKPVQGSATNLPFKDNSFTYVISVDCLEHIPTQLRAKAVREMLRVATKKVYLTFPVGAVSQDIDRRLDQYFYLRNGVHFSYLEEHVQNGLPPLDFIPQLLARNSKWSYTVSGNTSNWLWTLLLKMGLSNIPWQTSLYRRLLLLLPILRHCNSAPCYRQLYILTRRRS